MEIYNMICEQYATISYDAYQTYLDAKCNLEQLGWEIDLFDVPHDETLKRFSLQSLMENNAITAVVFQALAIEAYINLFGATELGCEQFYTQIEPPKNNKPKGFRYLSSERKLEMICELSEKCSPYPPEHLQKISALFEKRDRLVHFKPKAHELKIKKFDYEHLEKNYDDYIGLYKELGFVFDNIDDEMKLYCQLKNNIAVAKNEDCDIVQANQKKILGELTSSLSLY